MSFKFNRSGSMQELNKLLIAVYPYLIKALAVIIFGTSFFKCHIGEMEKKIK